MVRRFHRSIYDELDELRASMDYLYLLALEPADTPLLSPEDSPETVCHYVPDRKAEVTGHDDEVMVTVDTVPGFGISKLSVDLIDETTLTVTCDREGEEPNNADGDTVRELRSFSLHRIIPLPVPVKKDGARLSLRHGVLDICLKRLQPAGP